MEIKQIKDVIYKDKEGDFSVLYKEIEEINEQFYLLLDKNKDSVNAEVISAIELSGATGGQKEQFKNILIKTVSLAYDDAKRNHQLIYGR